MKDQKWTLYTHTTPDGMVYVGITTNTKNRWKKHHYTRCNTPFSVAINTWGWRNIIHEKICVINNKDDALDEEDRMILFCKENECSLNMHRSGGGDRRKSRHREHMKNRYQTDEEYRNKRKEYMKKRYETNEKYKETTLQRARDRALLQ